ncbi:hypothetical protein [Sutcliffiella sp. FSL R7-0096]|uniref:hypothetical protein n=1 Tax=Sutcliffiella sp. FSL R7-0096 TaxID=2921670 RepID=UPI003159C61A
MSFYYEQRGCCSIKKDHHKKEDHKKDDLECFCSKFLKKFFGQDVEIFLKDGTSVEGRILCIDKDTGIVTGAGVEITDVLVVDYICCKFIVRVRPL